MTKSSTSVSVVEDYGSYVAPTWVRPTVERLLATVPPAHLHGLRSVVLTDADRRQHRRDSRRQRSKRHGEALGSYHRGWAAQPPWVELVVNEIISIMPKRWRWLRILQDQAFAGVLFHEIGHHVHLKFGSAGRDPESGAEAIRLKLQRDYMRARYWYLVPVTPALRRLIRALGRQQESRLRAR